MGTGFAKRKKQAKQLQKQFEDMQDQMKTVEVTGQAGNGLVTVKMNGEYALTDININPECVDQDDIEGLEDLIKAAFEDAFKQVGSKMPDMGSLGQSFGLGL